MLQHIFRGRRSAWFPLLTARRFSEFDTCNLPCLAYTLFRFVSIARYVLSLQVLALQGQILKYSVNILLTCILYCDTADDVGPGYLITTVCKHSALHKYHIYLRPPFLQRLP